MANDFTVPLTPSLEKLVHETTTGPEGNFEAMRAGLKAALRFDGTAESRVESGYGRGLAGQPGAPKTVAQLAPIAEPTHMRIVYPWQNTRMEIYGMSDADLDSQEAAIRAIYSGR